MKTIHIGPNESITITAAGDSIELAAMLEASGALGGTSIAKARWLINDRASLIKTLESVRKERDEAREGCAVDPSDAWAGPVAPPPEVRHG